jgi:hypothetical protein
MQRVFSLTAIGRQGIRRRTNNSAFSKTRIAINTLLGLDRMAGLGEKVVKSGKMWETFRQRSGHHLNWSDNPQECLFLDGVRPSTQFPFLWCRPGWSGPVPQAARTSAAKRRPAAQPLKL